MYSSPLVLFHSPSARAKERCLEWNDRQNCYTVTHTIGRFGCQLRLRCPIIQHAQYRSHWATSIFLSHSFRCFFHRFSLFFALNVADPAVRTIDNTKTDQNKCLAGNEREEKTKQFQALNPESLINEATLSLTQYESGENIMDCNKLPFS